jgi:hypothetical protein
MGNIVRTAVLLAGILLALTAASAGATPHDGATHPEARTEPYGSPGTDPPAAFDPRPQEPFAGSAWQSLTRDRPKEECECERVDVRISRFARARTLPAPRGGTPTFRWQFKVASTIHCTPGTVNNCRGETTVSVREKHTDLPDGAGIRIRRAGRLDNVIKCRGERCSAATRIVRVFYLELRRDALREHGSGDFYIAVPLSQRCAGGDWFENVATLVFRDGKLNPVSSDLDGDYVPDGTSMA